jgi:hypothetical protein
MHPSSSILAFIVIFLHDFRLAGLKFELAVKRTDGIILLRNDEKVENFESSCRMHDAWFISACVLKSMYRDE